MTLSCQLLLPTADCLSIETRDLILSFVLAFFYFILMTLFFAYYRFLILKLSTNLANSSIISPIKLYIRALYNVMKKLLLYYVAIVAPFVLMLILRQEMGTTAFAGTFMAYGLMYRPLVDGARLRSLGMIEWKDVWRFYFSLQPRYFKALYFSVR